MLCGLQLKRRATFLLEAHEEAERRRIEAEARAKQEQDDLEAGRPRMSMARRASELARGVTPVGWDGVDEQHEK